MKKIYLILLVFSCNFFAAKLLAQNNLYDGKNINHSDGFLIDSKQNYLHLNESESSKRETISFTESFTAKERESTISLVFPTDFDLEIFHSKNENVNSKAFKELEEEEEEKISNKNKQTKAKNNPKELKVKKINQVNFKAIKNLDTREISKKDASTNKANSIDNSRLLSQNLDNSNQSLLLLNPPTFSMSYDLTTIGHGSTSKLIFVINNSASAAGLRDISFTDNLPAGMTIANPSNATNTCSLGELSTPDGGSTISYSGGSMGANSSCTITVNVTSNTVGVHDNITGDLTSSSGNSGPAFASLTVSGNMPGFSKSFSPSSINLGERSTLTFTIDNTLNANNLNGLNFTDILPAGMVVANPANASLNCFGGTLTAMPGSNSIVYNYPLSVTPTLSAGASCTISVDVIGNTFGQLINETGNLSSNNNFNPSTLNGKAAASLNVLTPPQIFIKKTFATNPVSPGGTTELIYTISNLSRESEATNITFTENLTNVLTGLTATGTPLTNICGSGSSLSGSTLLTLSGGNIPAEGSVTFSVPLQIPVGAVLGSYPSISSAITADINGRSVMGNFASENLFIADVPTFSMNFLNDPIPGGGISTLEFVITNTSSTSALTNITFIDIIEKFIAGSTLSNLPASGSCGAGSIFFMSTTIDGLQFQMSGGNIDPNSSCTFSADVKVSENINGGQYTNNTSYLSGILDGKIVLANPAIDQLEVLAVPRISKSFLSNPVNPGSIVNLEYTITYDEFASGDATDISFLDNLDAILPGLAAVGLPMTDMCGTGAQISGTTSLTFTGGALSPGGSCTFIVPVLVPAGAIPGNYSSSTGTLTATVGEQVANSNIATDELEVGGISFSQEFLTNPVIPGDLTTLRFTIDNTSIYDASDIIFTNNLTSIVSGTLAEAPLPVSPCGGSFVAGGNILLLLSGATVNAGSSCTFDVPVRIPLNATSDTYNNITSALSLTLNGIAKVLPAASGSLVVNKNLISLSKAFINDPVIPGQNVTVEYTLSNLGTAPVTAIAFSEDFESVLSGMTILSVGISNCDGIISGVGTGLLDYTGGSLGVGSSCTFSLILQTPASASYGSVITFTSSGLTGTISGLPVVGDPASDDLIFQSLQFNKSFSGPVVSGGTTTLTYSITNTDPSRTFTEITFSDDLDAFISGAVATNLPLNGTCGAFSRVSGTSTVNFARGELSPGQTCAFAVSVKIPCETVANTYSSNAGNLSSVEILNAGTASADLIVNSASQASFIASGDLCLNEGLQLGLGGGTPTGGIYSGLGVTDDANGLTYSFDPLVAGIGTHILTYTFTDINGCVTSSTDNVEVFAIPSVTFSAPSDICVNAGVQSGLGGGLPIGGVYEGPGVTDDGNGTTYTFDPTTAKVGVHSLSYSFTNANNCTTTTSDGIEVFALPVITFAAPFDLCIDAGLQSGLGGGLPIGGVYSGPGVIDDGNGTTYTFNPSIAGVGLHTFTYTFTNANNCTSSEMDGIEVFPRIEILSRSLSEFNDVFACENGLTKIGINVANPSLIAYKWQININGIFTDLAETTPYAGVSTDTLMINPSGLALDGFQYRAIISNGCEVIVSDTFKLKVGALPIILQQPITQSVCLDNVAVLEVEVNGLGVSYQWQIDNGGGFENVNGPEYYGINSKKLIISNFSYSKSGKPFRCLIYTACFQVPSQSAIITINSDVTILSQPSSQTVCEFSSVNFLALAVKLSPGVLNYQWQRKTSATTWENVITGGRYVAIGNKLTINNVPSGWNGAVFRCLINDYCQTIPKTLNVTPVANVTKNPVNQEICVGNNASFTVNAQGENLSYRWQVNSGSGFINLLDGGIYQGVTSPVLNLSLPPSSVNGFQYRCFVSGTSSCDFVADTSAIATISVGISPEAQTVFWNSDISTAVPITQAVGYILAINSILQPNGKAEFRAGNSISLNPGFEVETGAVFIAKIMNPCQTSNVSSGSGSKVPKELVK
ncbi:3-coathanger stack domain-containing protein [Lacihabitans sp. LS3-19]|uniref:DUF7933 domain-containing protein n=1 Tax=Lacihabitans sp. LS3-19 TaxID=2487335 RepID=UPI0020CC1489|nr:3-coathanger stack domain-containing protein [Lacihabitans sp. LS3-19]